MDEGGDEVNRIDLDKHLRWIQGIEWEVQLLRNEISELKSNQNKIEDEVKHEGSSGCVWCKSDNKVTHNGEHFCFFCSYCGRRLEVEQ